jgi:hypothetical protein
MTVYLRATHDHLILKSAAIASPKRLPCEIAHPQNNNSSREPLPLADGRSMHTEPTHNSFDPAIWAIAAALSVALLYLVLLD